MTMVRREHRTALSALEIWPDYAQARNDTLARYAREHSPWLVANADDKPRAGLDLMRLILSQVPCPLIDEHRRPVDASRVGYFSTANEATALTCTANQSHQRRGQYERPAHKS